MNCLSDEVLRAKLDHELGETKRMEAAQHLATCEPCRKRLEQMSRASGAVARSLAELTPLAPLAPAEASDPARALSRFQARLDSEAAIPPRGGLLANIFSRHPMPAWSAAAIAVIAVILVTFAPARSLGQRVLAMLRVQKVTVVPVDFNVSPGPDTEALIRQVISNDVTVTLSPGKPQVVADAAQASALAGFQVRLSTNGPGAPHIGVVGEQAYTMALDQNRLQAILNSFGRNDLQIPASVSGQTIAVHIPKSAIIRYGNCPAERHGANTAGDQRSAQAAGAGCIMLVEAPSPIVSVPPDLNVNQLFQIGLEAAGMSPQEAQAFCQTVDWKSTLVVPIPSRASSYVEETVDGVQGDLIVGSSFHGRPAEFELIWVKNGVIYSIHGFGDSRQALALAGSLG
ncbi:MAG: anti-sigma factor family protein [Terriglobia bacterium]